MARILLLGKDGQVGRELEQSLAPIGEVVALGSRELDLARFDAVRETVRRLRPTVIVNAAAYNAVDRAESERELAMSVNGVAPGILAEESRSLAATVVHYSTDYVFDGAKREPYTEEEPPHPLSAYGRSKLAGEQAVQQAGGAYLILRTSWVYSLRRDSFVTKVLQWARTQRALRIVADQVSIPTWCRNLARATAQILTRGGRDIRGFVEEHAGIYHLADKGSASRYDWAREILRLDPRREEQIAEELLPARSDDFPSPARRPAYSVLDCGRAERVFQMRLEPWQEALAMAMKAEGAAGR